eukprot:CAMPEP_0203878660 /NCGR_PEP_ID=MMETSP0359-20131031/23195_1 /ASSEMBLY_ACC=CAM_ASM_000338 /TAXON_ID=268821 /ORGANISM="Scrippsiella Hangoei, Strain SHTV-5" /LENGTH=62 /DNA_ID=CAMNT_0050797909 /DNA_START=138 /DNA_END=322 /DNA_ORIENTATION=+
MANIAWSCAKLQFAHEPLLSAISAQAILRISEFINQGLANTLWAFAKVAFASEPLIEAIAAA